jgi:uncharacterized protein
MPSALSDLAVAQRFLKSAFAADWDTAREVLADDVTWTMPGETRISGTARGPAEVIGRVQQITGSGLQLDRIQVMFWLVGQEGVSVLMHNSQVVDGHRIEEHMLSVYRVRAGRVGSIATYIDDLDGFATFFG